MTMRAVTAPVPGGPDSLVTVRLPRPEPRSGEVLIEVVAAGVNRADVMQRQGAYDPPPGVTDVLGLECSGVVVATGADVEEHWLGMAVCALLAGGGYAEYVAVPIELVLPVPDGVSVMDAAGLVETAATVWSNLVERGRLTAGETVLVHGGASGIGATAIQLSRALGATVITTVGSAAKAQFCQEIGASLVIDYSHASFEAVLGAAGRSVDVVVDVVGGPYLHRNLQVLGREGRLVLIGLLGGPTAQIDLSLFLAKNLTLVGSGLRTRPLREKAQLLRAVEERVWPLYASGDLVPTTDRVFSIDQASRAHELLEGGAVCGKVLLAVQSFGSTITEVA